MSFRFLVNTTKQSQLPHFPRRNLLPRVALLDLSGCSGPCPADCCGPPLSGRSVAAASDTANHGVEKMVIWDNEIWEIL